MTLRYSETEKREVVKNIDVLICGPGRQIMKMKHVTKMY